MWHPTKSVHCLFRLLALRSNEGGINAVTSLDWMIKMVFFIILIGVGPLELVMMCSSLVINMVVLHGPARGQRPESWQGTSRSRTRMVSRDGAGALGASVITHNMVLCLFIAMMIISLFEMAARLVAITAMLVLL